ncbi:TPA: phage portal protein [Vibrio parahaemolyticus]|uniref:phage portal protein n=1 Tax=Vibrio parahaemolyticus TaxID=670 RepID=UPI0002A58C7D|nr:phage portal protein [Vibrio parahaemolyticus]AGB11016.1 Phage capsid and scaffold protein [Vibrio parahaemolyticus BB22OP]MBE4138094.1 phage portal protein [Vibrio parahaemolyticus]MQF42704.1 phage portal protein [Vibrio parahaemolyticus]TOZ80023.1 phage portal protein [Vibrio parahaemolyticus]TOZ99743.1 phage portal protein [Vibrio parahaemolyticus]
MTEANEILVKQDNTENENGSVYSIDPTPELIDSSQWMTAYTELFYNELDDYWEPPISRAGLAEISRANAYHGSLLIARANYVAGRFVQGGGMRLRQMQAFCRDYFTFGDGGLLKVRNFFGKVVRLHPLPGMYMRRRKNGDFVVLERDNKQRVYKADDVIYLPQYDPAQQVYGLPDYLGAIQSSLLNTDATLFRRRYYKNGAHMGFIFYATDPNLSDDDQNAMKEAIASSKGVGNFRSMFVNIPNGGEKGIQLIPVGDIATKDEFERIKNITAQDILVGHRFPVGKAGIIPQGTGNMGDPVKIGSEYAKDEIVPVCKLILDEVNSDPEISRELQLSFNLEISDAA